MTGTNSPRRTQAAGSHNSPLINNEKLCDLYSRLIACRVFNQALPCGVARESGTECEAVTAAVTACLQAGDSILPTPRSFAAIHLLAHSFTPPGAVIFDATSQLTAATDDALCRKLERHGNITVVLAEAGTAEPMCAVFATAARQFLPVIYVLNDDPRIEAASRSIPAFRIDHTDTVAAYRVACESIARARDDGGPTILLCAAWPGSEAPDAVVRLEQYLTEKKLFRADWKRQLERKHRAAMRRLARMAESIFAEADMGAMPARASRGGML